MYINSHGLLHSVLYEPSPHYHSRPTGTLIDMIVLHGISLPPGQFGQKHIEPFFCGKLNIAIHPYFKDIADLKVSAHLLIDRQGEITQFVPFLQQAWHAGKSCFQEKERCNEFSIGIELEGTDDTPYTDSQYATLARIIPLLTQAYPHISPDRIVGHSDIAPSRKTDPGPSFDWEHLRMLLGYSSVKG